MREIVFRGKRRDTGEWVEGYFVHCKSEWEEERVAEIIPPETDRIYRGEYDLYDVHEVDSVTVGQFTGLTDKNSTRIFEGDIVDIDIGYLKRRGVVFCEESAAKFGLEMEGAEKNFSFLGRQMVKMYNVTVIGNIHDNPELIGERKDNG